MQSISKHLPKHRVMLFICILIPYSFIPWEDVLIHLSCKRLVDCLYCMVSKGLRPFIIFFLIVTVWFFIVFIPQSINCGVSCVMQGVSSIDYIAHGFCIQGDTLLCYIFIWEQLLKYQAFFDPRGRLQIWHSIRGKK